MFLTSKFYLKLKKKTVWKEISLRLKLNVVPYYLA